MKPTHTQGLTVAHKGFIIVGVALALELLLVGALTFLLVETDKKQIREAALRDRALLTARLMCADVDGGVALVKTWRFTEPEHLEELDFALSKAEQYTRQIKTIDKTIVTDPGISRYQSTALSEQAVAIQLMAQIGDISKKGLTFDNLREVWNVQRELNGVLLSTFQKMHKWYTLSHDALESNTKELRNLITLQTSTIAGGLLLQVFAAFCLFQFFSRNFIFTLETLSRNVDRMANKYPLESPLAGTDEIAQLDQSFRSMYAELQIAAEKEQALFENASDVICIIDEQFEIQRINSASLRRWGYGVGWLTGASITKFVPDAHWKNMKAILDESRHRAPAANFECDVITSTGPLRCLWSTFWSEQNHCWFCVVHDISEQHRLEKMRESFLSMIARDLQQPLESIYASFEALAANSSFNDSAKMKIDNSLNTLKRLTNLVGEILDFELLQSPESQLEIAPYNLRGSIDSSFNDIESLASAKHLRLENMCSNEFVCIGDSSKIVRVMVNLLSNAIKYSPDGGTIAINATQRHNVVTIEVTDEGPGISEEAAANLFKPFQQVHASDNKRGKGTGLGLVICKRLVEMHHGTIGVKSTPGAGSIFWLSIPLSVEPAEGNSITEPAAVEMMPGENETAAPSTDTNTAIQVSENPEHQYNSLKKKSPLTLIETLGLKRFRLLLIGIPVGFECILVAILATLMIQSNDIRERENCERELMTAAVQVCIGYLETVIEVSNTASSMKPQSITNAVDSIEQRCAILSRAARSAPQYQKEVATILRIADRYEPTLKEIRNSLLESIATGEQMTRYSAHDRLLFICDKVQEPVIALLDTCGPRQRLTPETQRASRTQQGLVLGAGLAFNILLAISGATVFATSITRRLQTMSVNAVRLAQNQQLLPQVTGSDEIAELDESFHRMAASLKEERKKERAYLDNSRDVIGSLDSHLRIINVNPIAAQQWETDASAMAGEELLNLLPEKRRTPFAELVFGLRDSEAAAAVQIESELAANHEKHILWSVSWSAKEQCYYFVSHDISRRRELERLKKDFIAVVSHDLRSPLGTIYGTTELMLHGVFGQIDKQAKETLSTVNIHVNQMLELINDLLDLEKLNAGQMQLTHSKTKLSEILDKAVLLVDAGISQKQQTLLLPAGNHELVVDVDRVSQAVANLILELAAISANDAQLSIAAASTMTGDTQLIIKSSTIYGSHQQIEEIQSRLSDMHSATDASIRGSRLRLPLAKTIIESHLGTLTATVTREGEPAFYVTLLTNPEHSMFRSKTNQSALQR